MTISIAIVGMGCRFAGAPDVQRYWEMALAGRNAFGPVPRDRWDNDILSSDQRRAADKTYAQAGAFMDDVRSFPALALGIPPRRVDVMDPQQRLMLEVALEAVEDSGRQPSDLPSRTGVFVGITAVEYRELLALRPLAYMIASGHFGEAPQDPGAIARAIAHVLPPRPYSAPGVLANMCAATVSQELDLHGPSYTVDAACASGLVAVANAVQQLRAGSIDAALAGGAYINLMPDHYIAFSRIGAMSKEGVCRPFDARADGFVQGEGGGVLVLKRLADAERDGDRIYGLIHGVSLGSDGRGDGPMAPAKAGQADVVTRAWQDAGRDPAQLGYVEAHGTGTLVGDPTEVDGLMEAIGDRVQQAWLGASKANVGHTMSAAGIAGMVRATLALHHETVPPLANFETPNDKLGLDDTPFGIPTEPQAWRNPGRLAGVSSFGFGGTNGHIVLGAASTAPKHRTRTQVAVSPALTTAQAELVLVSAPDLDQLFDVARRTADAIEADKTSTVAGVARVFAGRRPQPARLGLVAETITELVTKLRAVAAGEMPARTHWGLYPGDAPARVAFLYPGQGSQRPGMLADVRDRFPTVAGALDELEGSLGDVLPLPLGQLLYPERRATPVSDAQARAELTETANCQPALLACGVALTRLLADVGVRPSVVAGHSLGEFTAAAAAGVLSAADAARFVARRGLAMAGLDGDPGAMAALRTDAATADTLLVEGAVLANYNHPSQVVVSGFTKAVAAVVAKAKAADVEAIELEVSHGFHSPALDGLDVSGLVADLPTNDPQLPVASAIDGALYRDADHARDVFTRHALSPVRFTDALACCDAVGADVYLQVGAGGPLASFTRGTLKGKPTLTLASRDDSEGVPSLLESLARLWTLGATLDARPLTAAAPVAWVPPTLLPREAYWIVKETASFIPDIGDAKARGAVKTVATPAPAPETAAAKAQTTSGASDGDRERDSDPVRDKVFAVVAKVSAYPLQAIKPTMALANDLGFDSLMVADLVTGLTDAFDGIDGIPQEMLVDNPTVQALVDYIQTTLRDGGSGAAREEGPLQRWTPTWVATPLDATVPVQRDCRGKDVLVVSADGTVPPAFADLWTSRGATVASATPAAAAVGAYATDVVVFRADTCSDQGVAAGQLIAVLDRQARLQATPDVIALVHAGDPLAEGVRAIVRSVAREWPNGIAKTIGLFPTVVERDRAELSSREWAAADRTADVQYNGSGREELRFDHVELASPPLELTAADTVLVTGGTRGIGAKLAERLVASGAKVVLVGRGAPDLETAAQIAASGGRLVHARADVTDPALLADAVAPHRPITAIVHAAGLLADGPLGSVNPETGAKARKVKSDGFANAMAVAGADLRVALGVGSWAGRFGNRHQAHYAAGNALMAGLAVSSGARAVVSEFGPWTDSAMAGTIPEAVKAAMRAEGVDFVGTDEGLDALMADLLGGQGVVVHARRQPNVRHVVVDETIDVAGHPYLSDHAIEGHPVLPLASAADLLAATAGIEAPFQLEDLRLYRGVVADEPVPMRRSSRSGKAELRIHGNNLAYRANVSALNGPLPSAPEAPEASGKPELTLEQFYSGVTFHGPQLQGLTAIERVSDTFISGTVRGCAPSDWMPGTGREAWAIDPLAFDSAMQLAGYVAVTQYQRQGTPVSIGRYTQAKAWPVGEDLGAEVHIRVSGGDGGDAGERFTATVVLRDAGGALVALAEDVRGDLKPIGEGSEATKLAEAPLHLKPEWTNPALWPGYKDITMRLQMAAASGIRNPYFHVHEGVARDTTRCEGRELINFSSYNYIGLSGDPRVVSATQAAVAKYGTSVSASRVASGERPFHRELEVLLAEAQDVEDTLLFTAGHAANVSTIGHVMGSEDLILHDELIHDSILGGIKLSGANRRGFRHEDPAHLEAQLKELRRHYQKCMIVVEGVYSMDGDICDFPSFHRLKEKYGCLLMIDEAHSFGVIGETGKGVREHFGVSGSEVDIWMGTLSKSLASCGGWIGGSQELLTWLRYSVGGFVFSAGMTPANSVAALSSLKCLLEEPWRPQKLQSNARFFYERLKEHGLDTGPSSGQSAVVPVVTGNSLAAMKLSQRMIDDGINVQPIVYPAVPDDAARLRFFLSSTHSEAQLAHTAKRCGELLVDIREEDRLAREKRMARKGNA